MADSLARSRSVFMLSLISEDSLRWKPGYNWIDRLSSTRVRITSKGSCHLIQRGCDAHPSISISISLSCKIGGSQRDMTGLSQNDTNLPDQDPPSATISKSPRQNNWHSSPLDIRSPASSWYGRYFVFLISSTLTTVMEGVTVETLTPGDGVTFPKRGGRILVLSGLYEAP